MDSLYVHVPFCPTLCPYCDFQVVRRSPGMVEAYLKRLAQQAQQLYQQYPGPLRTLYLGGGTPSFLRLGELEQLFALLPWDFSRAEVTLEANPGTLNSERLYWLKQWGVNRLSLGVQSFQDQVLRSLGRAHGQQGALKAVELANQAQLRVSIDLILGLPGQNLAADLRLATQLEVGHISAYTLQIEPGTPFAALQLSEDPQLQAQALEQTTDTLEEAGLQRYEVSNFARAGQQSQHNLVYWRAGFWGALGPGATAQLPSSSGLWERHTHPPLPRWLGGEAARWEKVDAVEALKEGLMLGLRLREGLDLTNWAHRTGLPVAGWLSDTLDHLEERGLVTLQQDRLKPTPLGQNLLHGVILELWEAIGRESGPQKD